MFLNFCIFFFFQVFSFLSHIDLCRSAMVCRQWRVARAHEDFWKVLNFENMRISIEQCKFVLHTYVKVVFSALVHLFSLIFSEDNRIVALGYYSFGIFL